MTERWAREGSMHLSSDRIRRGVRLAVLALLLSFVIVAVTNATPPPSNQRAEWAAPQLAGLNVSNPDLFTVVDSHSSGDQGLIIRPPFLPNISENFYYSNITSPKTGEQYLVAVWYFDTWAGFVTGKNELYQYFQQHGTVTPVVLNLSPEHAAATGSDIVNIFRSEQWQAINATRYRGDGTSGESVTFATSYLSGENYYIVYCGIMDSADPGEETMHRLHLLLMRCLVLFAIHKGYEIDPTTPMAVANDSFNPASWIRSYAGFFWILFEIIGFTFLPVIALSYITAMMALWMNERISSRTRVLLPPIVAGCLLEVLAVRALFVTEIALGLTDLVATAILIPMGVLTFWPLFEGRLATVRRKWAVFICGAFTFFCVIIGNVSFILLTWVTSPGPVSPHGEPLLSIVLRSIVLRSGVIYLESLILATVFFSAIPLWDRARRRRQNHLPEGGGDR
ncbi:MAG: hypothetical protein ABFC89_00800 [Methanospirillum sp.]